MSQLHAVTVKSLCALALGLWLSLGRSDPAWAEDELDFLYESEDDRDAEQSPGAEPADGAEGGPEQESVWEDDFEIEVVPVAPLNEGTSDLTDSSAPFETSRTIEEIVVTAQKTEQTLAQVPISVSVIGGEFARDSAITDVQELVTYTSNVRFASSSTIPSATIRGFGSPPLGRNLEPSVGLVIDDVFYGRSTYVNDAVFDIERLEVLRGPQGTLFGKNTIAGLLNFTTAEPSYEPRGYFTVAGGSLDSRRAEGGFGFPLVEDRLAARIAFRVNNRDQGLFNTFLNKTIESRDLAGRLKLNWRLTDSLDLDLEALLSQTRLNGALFQLETATERALAEFREDNPRTVADAFDGFQHTNTDSFADRDADSYTFKLGKDFGDIAAVQGARLQAVFNRSTISTPFRIDSDFSPLNFSSVETRGPESYRQNAIELRFTGSVSEPFGLGEGLDLVAGVFGSEVDFEVTQLSRLNLNALIDYIEAGSGGTSGLPFFPPGGIPQPFPIDLIPDNLAESLIDSGVSVSSQSLAGFVQGTWRLTERLDAVLGLRYGVETREGFQFARGVTAGEAERNLIGELFANLENFESSTTRRESDFSPRFALSAQVLDNVNVFGSVARGFKSGGYSGPLLAPTGLEFEPEEALSFEIGSKTRLFDGSATLNVAAFLTRYENLQVRIFDGVNTITVNAPQAQAVGAEMDFMWLPSLDFLTIGASAGFTDARYLDFPCGPTVATDNDTTEECAQQSATPDDPPATQDLSDRTLPFAPRFTASFYPSITLPLLPQFGIGARLGLDVLYQGEQFLDADLDPNTFQRATTKINARLGIGPEDRSWSLLINAKNLTREQERVIVLDVNQLPGNYTAVATPDEPLYSLDLQYRFGQ